MLELGICDTFQLWDDAFGQYLAKFHTLLIEGIDIPDHSLGEDAMLVKCHEFAERFRREAFNQKRPFFSPALTNIILIRSPKAHPERE